jgi:hypothetical protein
MIERGVSGGTLLGNVFSFLLLLRRHVDIFGPVNLRGLIGRPEIAGAGDPACGDASAVVVEIGARRNEHPARKNVGDQEPVRVVAGFGLVIVIVSNDLPPDAITAGDKDALADGGDCASAGPTEQITALAAAATTSLPRWPKHVAPPIARLCGAGA